MLSRKRVEDNKNSNKLHAVFSKLSAVLPSPRPQELGSPPKTLSTDIIESVLAESTPVPAPANYRYDNYLFTTASLVDRGFVLTISALSQRLENELRIAKRTHLSCGEVLIPCGLLYRIACDIFSMAESEPCGIRGCMIFLNFEAVEECRKLACIKCDPGTANTFELNLTLKQNPPGWNFISHLFNNFAKGGTIMVSPAYILSKKKLYRSTME